MAHQARPPSRPRRADSSSSDESPTSSQPRTRPDRQRSPYLGSQDSRSNVAASTPSRGNVPALQNFSRPSISLGQNNEQVSSRAQSPSLATVGGGHQHQRKHSQGFFEPSLPTASSSNNQSVHSSNMANLTAPQIAAQAAMQQQSAQQHMRKRSQTAPGTQSPPERQLGRRKQSIPPPIQTTQGHFAGMTTAPASGSLQHQTGMMSNNTNAAATAASVAFPRSTHSSPQLPAQDPIPPMPDRDFKQKPEKSKMKLFSKPKSIGITKEKDGDKKDRGMPSPNKSSTFGQTPFPRMANASLTSLADSLSSTNTSIYGTANNSTATLVPNERGATAEKHRHHFLSRQKNKLKEKDDHHHLPLSSASSNSKPLDPTAPSSLYSFTPSSPSPAATNFAKSMSGLDLRHGGRALREKKKEEKSSTQDSISKDGELPFPGLSDWPGPASITHTQSSFSTPSLSNSTATFGAASGLSDILVQTGLQGIGLSGMTADDAWPYLKARLLVIFEGEDLRLPIEDFNRLVTAHLQRCIQRRSPNNVLEELRDLLESGFSFLDHTLRTIPDERLVRSLVDMWIVVFGTILPYLQAVFLPLDLEFKGRGPLLNAREAAEFWGALPNGAADSPLGDALDVRRIVLLSYRDTVILPRHDKLKAIFSRLSLESINGGPTNNDAARGASPTGVHRPGTAMSLDPGLASYNSQGSTLINEVPPPGSSLGARSRAASNSSSAFGGGGGGDLPGGGTSSNSPQARSARSPARGGARYPTTNNNHPPNFNNSFSHQVPSQVMNSAHITETVGRMLQCVAVLGSVQSGDTAQAQMEGLAKTLKLNWLGRGRTGRNRRGFVGARVAGPTATTVTDIRRERSPGVRHGRGIGSADTG